MKYAAIQQANERVVRARKAVAEMAAAEKFTDCQKSWSDFLLAASGVYSKLQQGAKGCGTSEGWYGRKKHDRKTDPLMKYLHHARNADEHGIEGTTLQRIDVEIVGAGVERINTFIDQTGNSRVSATGFDPRIKVLEKYVKAKTVRDSLHKDTFDPPTEHLGQPLDPTLRVLDLARLGLAYLEGLVAEATQLPRHT